MEISLPALVTFRLRDDFADQCVGADVAPIAIRSLLAHTRRVARRPDLHLYWFERIEDRNAWLFLVLNVAIGTHMEIGPAEHITGTPRLLLERVSEQLRPERSGMDVLLPRGESEARTPSYLVVHSGDVAALLPFAPTIRAALNDTDKWRSEIATLLTAAERLGRH